MRTLRLVSPWMKGQDVKAAQRVLKVTADGVFGPMTASAVHNWKDRIALYPDALVNNMLTPEDQTRLLKGQKYPHKGAAPVRTGKVYRLQKPYMKHADIKTVQVALKFKPRDCDGVYGPQTANAVKAYKWRKGWEDKQVSTVFGDFFIKVVTGKVKLPAEFAKRAKARAAISNTPSAKSAKAADLMVSWASMGLTERPSYSNRVPYLSDLAHKHSPPISSWECGMGYPWCAFGTGLAGLIAGVDSARKMWTGDFLVLYVPAIVAAARMGQHGLSIVPLSKVKKGDLVCMNFDGGVHDHIGRVLSVSGNTVKTIECNTSGEGQSGSQADGGGVFVRYRPASMCTFVRES